jgi:DNA-binding NarL/FixJ family response regulator
MAMLASPETPVLADLVDGFRNWLAVSVVRLADKAIENGATPEAAQLLAENSALFSDGDTLHAFQALQSRLDRLTNSTASASSMDSSPKGAGMGLDCLTPRERDVARLVARGLTNKQIGAELVISHGTVMVHIKHILGRLGMSSRTQIAAWFAQQGELD